MLVGRRRCRGYVDQSPLREVLLLSDTDADMDADAEADAEPEVDSGFGGNTFCWNLPLILPAGRYVATTTSLPDRERAFPRPKYRVEAHTSCVKWPG